MIYLGGAAWQYVIRERIVYLSICPMSLAAIPERRYYCRWLVGLPSTVAGRVAALC
jgi:hypothetical protein